eukprot:Tbor_TRINITY_DN5337_c3_g1::TRINITY_DN5337_c3_g1_i1::g.4217::m.4217
MKSTQKSTDKNLVSARQLPKNSMSPQSSRKGPTAVTVKKPVSKTAPDSFPLVTSKFDTLITRWTNQTNYLSTFDQMDILLQTSDAVEKKLKLCVDDKSPVINIRNDASSPSKAAVQQSRIDKLTSLQSSLRERLGELERDAQEESDHKAKGMQYTRKPPKEPISSEFIAHNTSVIREVLPIEVETLTDEPKTKEYDLVDDDYASN